MNNRSKGRGRPGPDAINIKHIVYELEKALNVEEKYMTNLFVADQNSGEDALLARDAAARKLRFLKTWFDLSCQVFLTAINLLDRFLTKMKVKPSHLGCVSISCLYVASELHKCQINPSQLVSISQTKCRVSDLDRMSDIIREKLGLERGDAPITAFNYLNHYLKVLECAAKQLKVKSQFSTILQRKNLLTRLEVVMLDSECACMRPSIIALSMIQSRLEKFMFAEVPCKQYVSVEMYRFLSVINELQIISTMLPHEYALRYGKLKNVVQNYDNNIRTAPPSRLKWRLSLRLNTLRPLVNFRTNLFLIRE